MWHTGDACRNLRRNQVQLGGGAVGCREFALKRQLFAADFCDTKALGMAIGWTVAKPRTLYWAEDAGWWRSLSILLAAATCLILPGKYREPFAEGVDTCLVGLTEVGSIGEPFAGCTQGIEIVKVSLGGAI